MCKYTLIILLVQHSTEMRIKFNHEKKNNLVTEGEIKFKGETSDHCQLHHLVYSFHFYNFYLRIFLG